MKKYCLVLLLILLFQPVAAQSLQDTLRVGYTTAPPFIIQEGEALTGINIWLWKRVAKELDLTYELKIMAFPEMLQALREGDIDVSINPLTITSERSRDMEFTHSFYASNATIAVAEASAFHKFMQFLKAFFSANFIKGFLLLFLIIFLFGVLGWYFEKKANPAHFRSGYKGIWDGLWWSAVTLTTVGYGDKAPKTRWGKVAGLILMFGGLLFISGLTASIASSLTVTQLSSNPDSFHEFKERQVGSVSNTSTTSFLRSYFFKKINLYNSVSEGLTDLKKGKIEAFMYDEPILKYRINQDSSLQKLHILPVKFDVQFYAFGIAKDKVELEQLVSQRILSIMETEEWQIILNEFGLSEL